MCWEQPGLRRLLPALLPCLQPSRSTQLASPGMPWCLGQPRCWGSPGHRVPECSPPHFWGHLGPWGSGREAARGDTRGGVCAGAGGAAGSGSARCVLWGEIGVSRTPLSWLLLLRSVSPAVGLQLPLSAWLSCFLHRFPGSHPPPCHPHCTAPPSPRSPHYCSKDSLSHLLVSVPYIKAL